METTNFVKNGAYVIAEIGTSHSGNLDKAKRLVEAAKSAGADCVKTQIVFASEILHPKCGFVPLPTGKIALFERFKSLECDADFFLRLKDFCDQVGIDFSASPFGKKSFAIFRELDAPFVKIASPELNHFELLRAVNDAREKCALLSCGVAKLADIEAALDSLPNVARKVLMHCVVSYPAREEGYNLRVLPNLAGIFGCDCGVSDHSLDPIFVPLLAVARGAKFVEKHLCLSKDDGGLDDPVALDGAQFAQMTAKIRDAANASPGDIIADLAQIFGAERVEKASGDGIKRLAADEEKNYGRTNRSLHFLRDMKRGEKISRADVAALRTEKTLSVGISPRFLDEICGMTLERDAHDGDGVTFSHFKAEAAL